MMIERPRDRSHEVRADDDKHVTRECIGREGPKDENIKVHYILCWLTILRSFEVVGKRLLKSLCNAWLLFVLTFC